MPKYFPGVTHAKVLTLKSTEDMGAMGGTIAVVLLCFSQDDDCIQPIRIKKMPGPTTGVTAELPFTPIVWGGKKKWRPTITGSPAAELKVLALVAFDKVKQQFGLKFGKTYKVFANTIEEVLPPQVGEVAK